MISSDLCVVLSEGHGGMVVRLHVVEVLRGGGGGIPGQGGVVLLLEVGRSGPLAKLETRWQIHK